MGYVEEKPFHFIPKWDGSIECLNKYNKILDGKYLACEIKDIDDAGANVAITKQDEKIFKRGRFCDGVTSSVSNPQFSGYLSTMRFDLFLRGTSYSRDHYQMWVHKEFLIMFIEEILRLNEFAEESKKGGDGV